MIGGYIGCQKGRNRERIRVKLVAEGIGIIAILATVWVKVETKIVKIIDGIIIIIHQYQEIVEYHEWEKTC